MQQSIYDFRAAVEDAFQDSAMTLYPATVKRKVQKCCMLAWVPVLHAMYASRNIVQSGSRGERAASERRCPHLELDVEGQET